MMKLNLLEELLIKLREVNINCCVETSLYVSEQQVTKIIPYIDENVEDPFKRVKNDRDIMPDVLKDLKAAEAVLPEVQAEPGRPTVYACKAIIAKCYLYQKDYMPCEDDVVHYDTFMKDHLTSKQKNEGTLRIRYNVMEEDASLDYTIIGLQKNGKLEKVEELDIIAAMEGHLTPEEILAQSESSSKGATVFYFAIAAVLVGLGIWKFIKAGKSPEEQKSKKRV